MQRSHRHENCSRKRWGDFREKDMVELDATISWQLRGLRGSCGMNVMYILVSAT